MTLSTESIPSRCQCHSPQKAPKPTSKHSPPRKEQFNWKNGEGKNHACTGRQIIGNNSDLSHATPSSSPSLSPPPPTPVLSETHKPQCTRSHPNAIYHRGHRRQLAIRSDMVRPETSSNNLLQTCSNVHTDLFKRTCRPIQTYMQTYNNDT